MSSLRLARRSALLLSCAIGVFGGAGSAQAANTCSAAAGVLTVTGDGTTNVNLQVSAAGAFSNGVNTCGGATTATVNSIAINGGGIVTGLNLAAPLENGSGEIKTTVTNASAFNINDASPGNRTIRVGDKGNDHVIDLNGDGDTDITDVGGKTHVGSITTGAGNDALSGAGGFDGSTPISQFSYGLDGGAGSDTLTGPGTLIGGPGNDTMVAGTASRNWLTYNTATGPVRMKADLSGTEAGFDGFGGTDTYQGFGAVTGGITVSGSPFDDIIYGTGGLDNLSGGAGNDTLYGGATGDLLDGGPGDDTFADLADGGQDIVTCGTGTDSGVPDRIDTLASDCEFKAPTLSIANAQATEGSPVQFTVTLSQAVGVDSSATLTTTDGTAKDGTDYTKVAQTVTVKAGQTTVTVPVATLGNTIVDGTRNFTATLSNPSSTPALGTATATGSVLDDDVAPPPPADTTAPVVTCGAPVTFNVGEAGSVTATVTDSGSGAATATVSKGADTTTAGDKTVVLTGADKAGNTASATCAYSVVAAPVVLCGQDIVLLDVIGASRKVHVAGIARPRFAGQTVSILAGGSAVGSATVAADGSFGADVALPAKALRSTIRYQAKLPTATSRALKLERKLQIVKRAGLSVSGKITAPKSVLPKQVTFYQQLTCVKKKVFASASVTKSGTFKITLKHPTGGEPYALYRVTAALRRGKTYTLPIAVS